MSSESKPPVVRLAANSQSYASKWLRALDACATFLTPRKMLTASRSQITCAHCGVHHFSAHHDFCDRYRKHPHANWLGSQRRFSASSFIPHNFLDDDSPDTSALRVPLAH